MMKFIHVTDTHYVPKGKMLYGRDPRETLEIAIIDINKHHNDAELMVITGDLTHWGEKKAFINLKETLSECSVPWRLLVGNHDKRDNFLDVFPSQQRDASGFVQSTMSTTAGTFIFLDTSLEGTHAGHFCETRQNWLANTLAQAMTPIFIFMHHPPFDTGIGSADKIGLQQKENFQDIIQPHKHRVRHLFFGHIHRPISGSWIGIPVSSIRGMNHQVWFDMTAEKLRGSFEPPAYAVVLISKDAVVIHNHDFLDSSKKFILSDSPWNDWSRRSAHS